MNGVLGRPALARQDIALGVARTQRLGARWRVSENADGSAPRAKDLTGYTGELRVTSHEGDLWLTLPLDVETGEQSSGLVQVEIPAETTAGASWRGRHTGLWAFIMTSDSDEVTVLASGRVRVVQEGTL